MALTKDVMALTTGYVGTHRIQWLSQQDMVALTEAVMELTTGCNGSHNRI